MRLPFVSFRPMTNQNSSWTSEATRPSTRKRLWRYLPLLLWLAFIYLASTSEFSAANTSQLVRPLLLWLFPNLSEARLAAVHFMTRKAAHFTEYAVLALLARRAFITSSYAVVQQHWFRWALLLVVTYALLDEFHQSFVSSRTASIYDSAIDVAGGLTVLLILKLRGGTAPERDVQVAPG
jgi:VanZ family protein